MFSLDIETLGTESTSVVLSIGISYVPLHEPRSYQQLLDRSAFIKLSAKDQIDNYGRTVDKDTLDWWSKQCDFAKKRSYFPSDKDMSVVDGLGVLANWIKSIKDKKAICWVRGSLDQTCLDSLHRAAGIEVPFRYNSYRDVRTAIELMYQGSENGYVEVDPERCPGFTQEQVVKHDPVHDAAYDIAMILYGK